RPSRRQRRPLGVGTALEVDNAVADERSAHAGDHDGDERESTGPPGREGGNVVRGRHGRRHPTLRAVRRALVVLPTYQEAANVAEVLQRIRSAAPDADVLVVDDSSPDGTADLAAAAGAELGSIDVLRRPVKAGLGPAYRAGFAVGLDRGYETLVEMDAD